MARPKKSDAIDIQDRAVTEVIAQLRDGTHTFSLNTIAKKIGCSAPALYAYFSSKDDLLDHVRQRAFQNLLAQKQHRYEEQASTDPVQNLQNGGHYFISFAQENPNLYRLIFTPDHNSKSTHINVTETLLQPLINGVRAAQPDALKQGIEAEPLAYLMWNAVHGAILMALEGTNPFSWDQAYEVVDTVMKLLFPTPHK
ncbi:MAG: TetR/AcrR family transcriptional regulator [Terasakiella sp.]|uniref:TetR/AcrR family transcriptional regulator n=1 Tax=unclassified Terasakiella TaxID=2614952 RepID=UPI003B008698